MKPRARLRPISEETKARRKASGELVLRSSVRPAQGAKKQKLRQAVKRKSRPRSETLRIYGPKPRRDFVTSMECVGCVLFGPIPGCMIEGKSEQAHVCGNDGMSRKAHFTTIAPLGRSHHHLYDHHLAPFDTEGARRVVQLMATNVENRWRAHLAGES